MILFEKKRFIITLVTSFFVFFLYAPFIHGQTEEAVPVAQATPKTITQIHVIGNKLIPADTIYARIPYRVGDKFQKQKSRQLIKTLYGMETISSIQLNAQEQGADGIELTIIISEKQPIAGFSYSGNSQLKKEDIEKKIKVADLKAIEIQELQTIAEQIKKLYAEKDYHHTIVIPELTCHEGITTAHFTIQEGEPTRVQRVCLEGNRSFSSKRLRSLLFTREEWLLGFINKAGSFQPDALEYDKSMIENFYHNNGFLAARVTQALVDPIPGTCKVNIKFLIEEGDIYTIESVKAAGNSILSEDELLRIIAIRPGQLYSKELIRNTIESLRIIWGEYGYIYAEIEPIIIPDEQKKTVTIEFQTNLGNCMRLNRIVLVGNKKTRDKVIRRQLLLDEGELITTRKLDLSKERVLSLGFFDQRNGVNWKIIKVDEEHADLELMLEEIKTGQFYFQMGTGGIASDKSSPSEGFRVSIGAQERNLLGLGIQGNLNASYSRQDRSIDFSISNPWLFDRPLYGGFHFFNRQSKYDEFRGVQNTPTELTLGGYGQLGFTISQIGNANALAELGFEHIQFNRVISLIPGLQPLLDRKFQSGRLLRLGFNIIQDMRNHPILPSRGYVWTLGTKFGVPHANNSCFSFAKAEFDIQWFTPLINEYDLILRAHAFLGIVKPIQNHTIPYRELYHIGGPATVRGFNFGQIGPTLVDERNGIFDSLGAEKAFVANLELLFPITKDGSIRGVVFYDGGAGWDTPDRQLVTCGLRNNEFNFRHAIGFGVRLTRPSPVRVDVGFKLDRKKRLGETLSEVHFAMTQDF